MARTVGWIGAGEMGAPMARRLVAAGHEVAICERNPATLAAFRAGGLRCSTRAADVADAEVIVIMVSTDKQILSVLSGPDGLIAGLPAGSAPTVLIMSTCMPATVIEAARRLAGHRASLIDAPVSGGLGGAENGTLSIMLGGPDAAVDRVLDILGCLGRNLFRCGPVGAGQTTKLINNMVGLTNLFLVSEAYEIARSAGLRLEDVAGALDASAGRNNLSRNAAVTREQFATWARTPEAFDALMGIVRKDIGSAAKLARQQGLKTPLLDTLTRTLGVDVDGVYDRWRALAGMP